MSDVAVPPIIRSLDSMPQSAGKRFGEVSKNLDSTVEFVDGQHTCENSNCTFGLMSLNHLVFSEYD